MKTEFYAGLGMHNKLIKTLEGVIVPPLQQGDSVEIDDYSYRVRSYGILIEGNDLSVIIRLD